MSLCVYHDRIFPCYDSHEVPSCITFRIPTDAEMMNGCIYALVTRRWQGISAANVPSTLPKLSERRNRVVPSTMAFESTTAISHALKVVSGRYSTWWPSRMLWVLCVTFIEIGP